MAPVTATTVVDRPAAQVFAYATDPAHFRDWQRGLTDGHLDPPLSGDGRAEDAGGGWQRPSHDLRLAGLTPERLGSGMNQRIAPRLRTGAHVLMRRVQ